MVAKIKVELARVILLLISAALVLAYLWCVHKDIGIPFEDLDDD